MKAQQEKDLPVLSQFEHEVALALRPHMSEALRKVNFGAISASLKGRFNRRQLYDTARRLSKKDVFVQEGTKYGFPKQQRIRIRSWVYRRKDL